MESSRVKTDGLRPFWLSKLAMTHGLLTVVSMVTNILFLGV